MKAVEPIVSPEQIAPVLISVRTRAFELARDIVNIVGQAGSKDEMISAFNATILGRVVEGGISSLYDAEVAAYRLLAQQFSRISRVIQPSSSSIVKAYNMVIDTRDILIVSSYASQGRSVEEAPIAAPESPIVKKFIESVSEEGLTALPRVLRSLGYDLASKLLEAGRDIPLGLALDLELLISFSNARREYSGTPAERILCGRLDMYSTKIVASAAPLAKKSPEIADTIVSILDTCKIDKDRLAGVLGEDEYYSALEQALAGNPYISAYAETTLPLVDTVIHAIRKTIRSLAEMYSLSDPLEDWFACPVMELMLLSAEDVSSLVSGLEMGLVRESLHPLLSIHL
jgi:vacuolar-type H+-ATPase subunit C/Vma6